ncbi:LacI family transcriptional regulator [Reticulibacter mediterranei]|uniref:LacI family transcriptional regulator n=1 Tax=Reticulibacter mediterranei TaxID=2778369 RepID=A0A8J3N4B0_9CHLR|nr:LacI family DNA-binding transcriptional regulator [Reticulibacter mediterranei]GHO93917.1 LacI family transcriptional regulator [Reticulibacter mediterranei]
MLNERDFYSDEPGSFGESEGRIDAGKMRPTMQNVAKAAGVSLKTVSRVVNNEPNVGEDTREKVSKVIEELGFRRNDLARNLRQGQISTTIGLIIEDIANPFYSNIAHGVEKVAQRYHYMVIICNSEENAQREQELSNALFRRRVAGLLMVPASHDHSYLLPEARLGTPIIFLDRPPDHLDTDTILLDNRGGARKGIEHLIAHGHRRIGVIGGDPLVHSGAERLAGYREALADRSIPYDEALLRSNRDEPLRAQEAVHELLMLADPPTALFTTNNRISIAVIRALYGMKRQIALVGFDDFELAELLPVPITVIAHDAAALGEQAAELLFARLHGDDLPPQHLVIPTELVVRGSGELPPE